jgi:hypothetical protein
MVTLMPVAPCRDGWIRRAELEPLGAEDGAGLDPATCFGRFRVS